jgi:hypothetical protein
MRIVSIFCQNLASYVSWTVSHVAIQFSFSYNRSHEHYYCCKPIFLLYQKSLCIEKSDVQTAVSTPSAWRQSCRRPAQQCCRICCLLVGALTSSHTKVSRTAVQTALHSVVLSVPHFGTTVFVGGRNDIKDVGFETLDWILLAQDRVHRRAIVNAVTDIIVFRVIGPYGLIETDRRFRDAHCLLYQGERPFRLHKKGGIFLD